MYSSKFLYCFFLLVLGATTSLTAYTQHPAQQRSNTDDVQIYNENYYPNTGPSYGYGGYYSGYPAIPTPAEAFPDDAEAEQLFNNLHD